MTSNSIAVGGGGIAGLAMAIGLARKGLDVEVHERAEEFTEIGAGLQLGPNAAKALQALGAWEAVRPIASAPPEIHIRSGLNGKLIQRIKLGADFARQFGGSYLVAHRAHLHSSLLDIARRLPTIEIKTGSSIAGLTQDTDGVTLETGDGERRSYASLIAADGMWSALRARLFSGSAAIALPFTIWRTLAALPSSSAVDFTCVNLWLHPHGHVVHYPVGPSPQLNLVVTTKGPAVLESFVNCTAALDEILTMPHNWLQWPAAHVPALPSWHSARTCLIGDAAHGTVPFLAQGAAMALEDAAVLSHVYSVTNPTGGFAIYDKLRMPRVTRLDRQSRSMPAIYHAQGGVAFARDQLMRHFGRYLTLSRLSWIYAYCV